VDFGRIMLGKDPERATFARLPAHNLSPKAQPTIIIRDAKDSPKRVRCSQWLHAELTAAGLSAILMTRHVKAALKAMTVKTDRNDARGMAQLMRMGWFRPSGARQSGAAQEIRALLTGRRFLLGKLRDAELGIRGLLRGFGG
jgi:hypothetical protein